SAQDLTGDNRLYCPATRSFPLRAYPNGPVDAVQQSYVAMASSTHRHHAPLAGDTSWHRATDATAPQGDTADNALQKPFRTASPRPADSWSSRRLYRQK